jgi:hypothetical protein
MYVHVDFEQKKQASEDVEKIPKTTSYVIRRLVVFGVLVILYEEWGSRS